MSKMVNQQFIPYGKQSIDEVDIQAVVDAISSEWISLGPRISEFEKKVAHYCGAEYAVAVSSGTAALHLAALASALGQGKRFWTSPISFVASANCGLYAGAEVDFVDINPGTYNMDIDELEKKLQWAKKEGVLPNVLIPVHFAGLSCPMKRISELGSYYSFKIIEDACHALGGDYLGEKVGCCRYSDMVVFSFHPVKSITTGEGGMVLTNNAELYERLQSLRNHGITRDPDVLIENHGPWYYEQHDLGFNYRITDIQSALGSSQMDRIDEFIAKRRKLAVLYDEHLEPLPVHTQVQDPDSISARHLYVIRLNTESLEFNRRQVFEGLREAGIGVQVHYIPVPMQPYYRNLGFRLEAFPESKKYYEEAITLPLYPMLKREEIEKVVYTVKKLLEA